MANPVRDRMMTSSTESLPKRMLRYLVETADLAAQVAQLHNARLTPGACFSGHRLCEASTILMARIESPPPAVPIGGFIAAKLGDVAFPHPLSAAVRRLIDAWQTYPDLPVSGYDPPAVIDAALATGDVRELSAAVVAILNYFPPDAVEAARLELAAEKRERELQRRRRNDELAAQRRKDRAEHRRQPAQYRPVTKQYYVSSASSAKQIEEKTDCPTPVVRKRGGDRKSGRSKYDVVFPIYDQLRKKDPDGIVTEALLVATIRQFRQRRPDLINVLKLTPNRQGAARLRAALKRRIAVGSAVVKETKKVRSSYGSIDESKDEPKL
jgi:hypothetical protein